MFPCFADGYFIPLGGQYISAALLALYKSLGGRADDPTIPPEVQFVEAEVLRANTPISICRLAAGEHQVSQKDVQSMTVAEIFAMMTTAALEKRAGPHKSPFLNDNDVHTVCIQCGLQKFRDRNGRELSPERQVCSTDV